MTEQAVLLERSHSNLAPGPSLAGTNSSVFLREGLGGAGTREKSLRCEQPALHQPQRWESGSGGAELPVTREGGCQCHRLWGAAGVGRAWDDAG